MQKFRVASIYESKAVCKNVAGLKAFIPTNFRDSVKVGDWGVLVSEHFDKSTKRNEDGEVEKDADGQPILIDKPYDRATLTFVGTFEEVVSAMNEERIYADAENSIVKGLQEKVTKQYQAAGTLEGAIA